jgi:hypothetical protein
MDFGFDELVRAAEKFGGDNHDGGRAIADFFVLFLRELDKDFGGGVLDGEEGEDGSSVVGDRDLL